MSASAYTTDTHKNVGLLDAGAAVPVPGVAPASDVERDVDAFLGGRHGPSHALQPMEAAWQGARAMPDGSTPLTPFLQVTPLCWSHCAAAGLRLALLNAAYAWCDPPSIHVTMSRVRVQAFVNSAKAHTHFRPLPSPPLHLSTAEQCRIRDRSTIMARHLYADRGDMYADDQVRACQQP